MHVVLIQPPDAPMAVSPRDSSFGDATRFVPSWDLQCLRSFLLNRTRYNCTFLDARLLTDLEGYLTDQISKLPEPRIFVVYATTHGLGPAAAILQLLKRIYPATACVLCGPHPSQYPEFSVSLPHVDYALCGDPEPILRNLLDNLDVEHRLRNVPGLAWHGEKSPKPYWVTDLKSLSLPDWQGVFWDAYNLPLPRQGSLAELRLSRGHTKRPEDNAFGRVNEPFREWPMDRTAVVMQKCAHQGVVEVSMADPPGYWTADRLSKWGRALEAINNSQPWTVQILPRRFTKEEAEDLQGAACTKIEFVFPVCEPAQLADYGCAYQGADMGETVAILQAAGIQVEARFWVGGPKGMAGMPRSTVAILKDLGFCPFSLHPYPVNFDSPLYAATAEDQKPPLKAWIAWTKDPWTESKPVALWGGQAAEDEIEGMMDRIERSVQVNPRRRFLRLMESFRSMRPINSMENRSLNMISRSTGPRKI